MRNVGGTSSDFKGCEALIGSEVLGGCIRPERYRALFFKKKYSILICPWLADSTLR